MGMELHPVTWVAFFAAVVCLLVAAWAGILGRRREGYGWLGAGIIFAVLTAVSTALAAGGMLTP